MTGRYPSAHRVTQNPANPLAVHGADLFGEARAAGYATAMIGKNHTYLDAGCADLWTEFTHDGQLESPGSVLEEEFDDWLAALRHRTYEEPTPFPVEAQNPHRIVDLALAWVSTVARDRPLLLVVSVPEPHNPYQVPEPYFSMFPEESLPPTRTEASALDGKSFPWRYLLPAGGGLPGLIHDGPHGESRWDELNAVTQSGRRRKLRSGDWALYADITGDFRLYNLREDLLEMVDRWQDPAAADERVRLLSSLAVWQMRAEDPLPAVPGGYRLKRDPRNYLAPCSRPTPAPGQRP